MLLILCVSVLTFAFLSNTKLINKSFVNYDINNHAFREFKMLEGCEMANWSQECILKNDCTGFELCEAICHKYVGLQRTVEILNPLWTILVPVSTLLRYLSLLEHDFFYKLNIAIIIYCLRTWIKQSYKLWKPLKCCAK